MHTVGDHDRDLPAFRGDENRKTEKDRHQQGERRKNPAKDVEVDGQIAVVDKETRADCGKKRVIQDARNGLQNSREDAEPATITNLQKLPHGHGPRFAETIGAISCEAQHHANGCRHRPPESVGEARLIVALVHCHQADQAHRRLAPGDADHVAPRHAPSRQKVRNPPHITLRPHADHQHNGQRDNDDAPINPRHCQQHNAPPLIDFDWSPVS